jgi:hypothetical protein
MANGRKRMWLMYKLRPIINYILERLNKNVVVRKQK